MFVYTKLTVNVSKIMPMRAGVKGSGVNLGQV